MRSKISLLALSVLVVSGCAIAQAPKAEDDHSAHHPAGNATAAVMPVPGSASAPQAFERQMKAMQDMHQKMEVAKSPAERAALMNEHMKLMQSGLAMMGQMRDMGGASGMGGKGGTGMMAPQAPVSGASSGAPGMQGMAGMVGMHQQMERRMTMMEQMMQMMVDREAAMPRK